MLANRSAVHTEYTKVHTDSSFASKSARLRARAEEELSKLDAEEKGEDFERKRAWDWTVQESEEWDKKLSEKKERRTEEGSVTIKPWHIQHMTRRYVNNKEEVKKI